MAADENEAEAQLAAIREAEEHFDIRVWEVTDDGDDAGKWLPESSRGLYENERRWAWKGKAEIACENQVTAETEADVWKRKSKGGTF